jgi:hypothetical protein
LAGVAPLWVGLATRFAEGAQQCLRPSTRITATAKHGLCYLDFISEFGLANIWQGYGSSRASRWCFAVSGADRFAGLPGSSRNKKRGRPPKRIGRVFEECLLLALTGGAGGP